MEIEYNTNGVARMWVDGVLMSEASGQTLPNNAHDVQGGNQQAAHQQALSATETIIQ